MAEEERDNTNQGYTHIIFRDLKNSAAQKIVPLSQRVQDLLNLIEIDKRQGFLFKSDIRLRL